MCDGITLDGAGYSLKGNRIETGVFLQERNNVTIKNLKITNFRYAIKFTWLTYDTPNNPPSNKVIDCTITNNVYGIGFFDRSKGSIISNNYMANNKQGIFGTIFYLIVLLFN